MSKIVCFFLTPTDRVRRSLRRFASGTKCGKSGLWYHDKSNRVDCAPFIPDAKHEYSHSEPCVDRPPFPDYPITHPSWPSECDCGYVFAEDDTRQLNYDRLYCRDDGTEYVLADTPPGAMWYAPWLRCWKGPDGKTLVVKTPIAEWCVDQPCPDVPWERTGVPPKVTARPSILMENHLGKYHAVLTDGVLES
jgi:hypothetical protein